jgi:phosphoglycerol transferase MdoB-like AlkP superfamily enzyme
MSEFLQGATFLASLAVALFFLRFWRQTREPLFAVFAAAFAVFAANRVALVVLEDADETRRLWVYVSRALVFAMIAGAVLLQNLRRRR